MSWLRHQLNANEEHTPYDLIDRHRKTKGTLRVAKNFAEENSSDRHSSDAHDRGGVNSVDPAEIPKPDTYPTGVEKAYIPPTEGGLLPKPIRKGTN